LSDLETARHELAAQDAVAVVWLCDDAAGAHALCFCGRDGRLVTRPVSVTPPLAPPDAAAVALSVKVLLGKVAAPGAPAPHPAAPAALPAPASAHEAFDLPALTVELDAGARFQSRAPGVGARFGLTGVYALDALHRQLGLGLGVVAGPSQTVRDVALRALARGRLNARPLWLDLDVGPSAHFLSTDVGVGSTRRTVLSLDVLAGVILPLGPYFAGVRAGALVVPVRAPAPPRLPGWTGEALLIFGANVL